MIYNASSSIFALIVNFKIEFILRPWRISVDITNQTITIEQRNWYLIGRDTSIMAFRFVRNVEINEHVFGADISIRALGSTVTAYYISKNAAQNIKKILIDFNQGNNSSVFFT